MTLLALPTGDDHPAAAEKHLADARVLRDQNRPDGAAYLSGYVVECSLKTLWLVENGITSGAPPKGRKGHDLRYLVGLAGTSAIVAGAKTAKYLGPAMSALPSAAIAAWYPEMRYRAPEVKVSEAEKWYREAEAIFYETVAEMLLDGVI